MLKRGEVIKADGYLWGVVRVSPMSAYIVPLTGKPRPITTRKGVTKMVMGRPAPKHVSADALAEKVSPTHPVARRFQEDIMAEEQKEKKEKSPRQTQVYVRTEKEAKDMKGQGAIVEKTKGQFQTRQSEERVVGFYLSKFKREGLAKIVEAPVAETSTEAIEA
jgi:hypothetical protein